MNTAWKIPTSLGRNTKLVGDAAIPRMWVLFGLQLKSASIRYRVKQITITTTIRLVACALVLIILLAPAAARAQVESVETDVHFQFGETIYFSGKVQSEIPVIAATLYFQAEQDTGAQIGLAKVDSLGNGRYNLIYYHRLDDYPIRPFSTIQFHWELTLSDGQVVETATEDAIYLDNRFPWQSLEGGENRVHWVQGDTQFAQDILNATEQGKARIFELLRLPSPKMLDIYVYSDVESMQTALGAEPENWVAGHADPDLGVILVTLPEGPEQRLLIEQRIPHELMHVALYQFIPFGYKNLPTWLSEGLASLAEMYPNPDYRILLEEAAHENSLQPISRVCDTFPTEAYSALLAYAESASFVRYLHNTFGTTGMLELITAYANGLDCERGVESVFGKELSQLEKDWQRDELSLNIAQKKFLNLLPWIILSSAVLAVPLVSMLIYLRPKPATSKTGGMEQEDRVRKSASP
jgi:hypothetical protein